MKQVGLNILLSFKQREVWGNKEGDIVQGFIQRGRGEGNCSQWWEGFFFFFFFFCNKV